MENLSERLILIRNLKSLFELDAHKMNCLLVVSNLLKTKREPSKQSPTMIIEKEKPVADVVVAQMFNNSCARKVLRICG